MAAKFPSDEWIKLLMDKLNASASYERSAKDWEGDFIFIIEPDGDLSAHRLFLGLYHGKCTGAEMLDGQNQRQAEFIIKAPLNTWRQVIEGKLDPIQGLMAKKLALQGNMMKVMRYPKAAKEIIACCAQVPTDFS